MVIDAHLHLMPPGLRDAALAGRLPGVAWRTDPADRASLVPQDGAAISMPPELLDWTAAVRRLDAEGIDRAVVMPVVNALPEAVAGHASVGYARQMNEAMAAAAAASGGRLAGLASLPTRVPSEVAPALRQAAALGLKGVAMASHGHDDAPLDADRFEPLWQAAEALGMAVFLHPPAASYPRLERFNLGNLLGNPLAIATAAASLVFGGVLDRHPGLKVVLSHGGGMLAHGVGRLDHGYSYARRGQRFEAASPASAYLRRFWYDAVVYRSQALRHLVETVGADRVLLGSDYPFDMMMPAPAARVTDAVDDPVARAMVLGGNARRLFDWP